MSASKQIVARVERAEPQSVFTPFDFLDLGSPALVGKVLLRLVREGRLRRFARGFYDVPMTHPMLGVLMPRADGIAQAIARRQGSKLQPTEALAANLLNLSEQVPAKTEYETDGPSRFVRIGKFSLRLRHRARRKLGVPASTSSLVFAGLRGIGRRHMTESRVTHLRKLLPSAEREQLLADLPFAPSWMHPFLRYIAGVKNSAPKEAPPVPLRERQGRKLA